MAASDLVPRDAVSTIQGLCSVRYRRGMDRFKARESPAFIQHCIELYAQQDGICALTGIPMSMGEPTNRCTQMSIDRLDGKCGYEIGNIRLTCAWANHALFQYGDSVFYLFMRKILAVQAMPEIITFTPLPAPSRTLLLPRSNANVRARRTHSPYHFLLHLCQTANVNKVKKMQLRCPQFRAHCMDLLRRQGMCCSVSGLEMTIHASNMDPYQMAILCWCDEKGYISGNVSLVCTWINSAFRDRGAIATLDFLDLCKDHF
jgi:hypothetical protein